jgi:L-serine dehydratase
MTLGVLTLFSIGIGPSSSHTVGPMKAAASFVRELTTGHTIGAVRRVHVELFGSLGATGRGHSSDTAVVMGLSGHMPETIDPADVSLTMEASSNTGGLLLDGRHEVAFDFAEDVKLNRRETHSAHPNTMVFRAFDASGGLLLLRNYASVGGGFIAEIGDVSQLMIPQEATLQSESLEPFPFATADELLAHCERQSANMSQIMLANELARHSEAELRSQILERWAVMRESVARGCESTNDVLPGKLRVPRRAPAMYARLKSGGGDSIAEVTDWVALVALAVNEENASGGRIVTAPTNGAAGIIPAVLSYCTRFVPGTDDDAVVNFFLTAAAIGSLFKRNASISGAEVGCQGEVGSACSMAAGALCELLGGTAVQVENAAEIGIEHNLGLTCDPIGGLVQIPCIERNAVAANKAITAARLALHGNGIHTVSLDDAIRTLKTTGADMNSKYKETSLGGLAVNVTEC